jgi:hypothetical protein
MKNFFFLLFFIFGFIFAGCASINSVSLTSIPSSKEREVKTSASRVIFLGFNFNNDYVDDMVENLQRQCPNGKISGILTKDESINYFLFFVRERRVTARGYCQSSESKVSLLQ